MLRPILQIKKLHPDAKIPHYMSKLAAGMDIHALCKTTMRLLPGDRCLVATGLAMAIPEGYEVQVRPRSGLAINHGIALVNSPGTIDADYRGEIKVILINHGSEPFFIATGDRIAQLIVAPVCQVEMQEVCDLSDTDRGQGGFGHTGRG